MLVVKKTIVFLVCGGVYNYPVNCGLLLLFAADGYYFAVNERERVVFLFVKNCT